MSRLPRKLRNDLNFTRQGDVDVAFLRAVAWRSFLDNHVRDLVSIDFFTVPTATLTAPRPVESPSMGKVIAVPKVGGRRINWAIRIVFRMLPNYTIRKYSEGDPAEWRMTYWNC